MDRPGKPDIETVTTSERLQIVDDVLEAWQWLKLEDILWQADDTGNFWSRCMKLYECVWDLRFSEKEAYISYIHVSDTWAFWRLWTPKFDTNMLLVLSPCSSVCSRCPKSLSCTMATLVGRRRWLGLGGPGSPAAHDPDSLGLRCDPKDPMIIYRILYIVYHIHLLSIRIISLIYI